MRYFYSSFAIMAIGLIAAFYLGGVAALYITILLIILLIQENPKLSPGFGNSLAKSGKFL